MGQRNSFLGKWQCPALTGDVSSAISNPCLIETFAVKPTDDGLEFIIGYTDINSNRISIKTQSGAVAITESIVFNANLFKEVLNANKECSQATLQIADKGLAHIEFNVDDFNVKYWLVSQQV